MINPDKWPSDGVIALVRGLVVVVTGLLGGGLVIGVVAAATYLCQG